MVKSLIKDGNNIYTLQPAFGLVAIDGIITKKLITTLGSDNLTTLMINTNNKLIDVGNSIVLGNGKLFEFDLSNIEELNDIIFY